MGQTNINLWKVVINKDYCTEIQTLITMKIWNKQGHNGKQWRFDPEMEVLIESQYNYRCLRYRKYPASHQ